MTYSYLSSLFADYLLSSAEPPDPDALSTALSLLPSTLTGLSLNPRFGSIDGFTPQDSLALFELSKVPLYHGWVVDPQDEETWEVVVGEAGDFDTAMEMQVAAAELSGGLSEDGGQAEMLAAVERRSHWTRADERKVALGLSHALASAQHSLTSQAQDRPSAPSSRLPKPN